jgi:two-component system cell cycle response regulator
MSKKVIIGVGIPAETLSELRQYFSPEIFEFLDFNSAQDLISHIKNYKVHLIFIYSLLPDIKNCEELCIALRAEASTEILPLIIITDVTFSQTEKIKMLKSGLIDGCLDAQVSAEEISAYANVFLQRRALEEELEIKNELLGQLSITDELTKLYNRRYLIQRLEEELKRIRRYDYPLSCIMLDIDHFKEINDKFGHSHGDIVLEQLSEVIKKTIRSIDIICRYGGEEIVIILPYTNFEGAYIVAERLRRRVEEHAFGSIDRSLNLTISSGLIHTDGKDKADIDSLFQLLDSQLYEAKNTGRNKVCGGFYKNLKK